MGINDSNRCNDISLRGMSIPFIKKACPLIKIVMKRLERTKIDKSRSNNKPNVLENKETA